MLNKNKFPKKIFITSIDTNVGKTIFTGIFAKLLLYKGKRVITHKIVQTGCSKISDDIKVHRKIMEMNLIEKDKKGETCPYIFNFPASPHLSAELENKTIDTEIILNSIKKLEKDYDYILIEGAGGLFVPLNRKEYLINFIQKNKFPTILVTSPKLGSINHTIMSLELLKKQKIEVLYLVYNEFIKEKKLIRRDTKKIFKRYLKNNFPKCELISIGDLKKINFNNILDKYNFN